MKALRFEHFQKFIAENKDAYKALKPRAVRCDPFRNCSPLVEVVSSNKAGATPASRTKWVIESICYFHGLSIDDVLGRSSVKRVVSQRRVMIYELRLRGWSYPKIGKYLGKDHSTIMHSLRTMSSEDKEKIDRRAGMLDPADPFLKGRRSPHGARVEDGGAEREEENSGGEHGSV